MTPFAAIDFETAGYDPASACSLGIVAANEDGSITEWHRLIRPPVMRFAPGCIAIHGIRPEDVEDKPEFPAFRTPPVRRNRPARRSRAGSLCVGVAVLIECAA